MIRRVTDIRARDLTTPLTLKRPWTVDQAGNWRLLRFADAVGNTQMAVPFCLQ